MSSRVGRVGTDRHGPPARPLCTCRTTGRLPHSEEPRCCWFSARSPTTTPCGSQTGAGASGVPVTVVTGELLAFARRRSHRLGRAGVHSSIELGDGTVLSDLTFTGVLNRLVEPPAAAWEHAAVGERTYAMAELHAFTLSWLTSLPCPVRNRPDPSYLAGPAPHPLLALAAARSVGLRTVPIRLDTSTAGAGYDGTSIGHPPHP